MKTTINLPNWVQVELKEEEKTSERMKFVLELVQFIETNGFDFHRIYFDRRGAALNRYNHDRPWRYNARGLAQAKLELARMSLAHAKAKDCLPADAKEVREVIEAYDGLGWGRGTGGRHRELTVRGGAFRFINRGRWYSLETVNIREMQKRAKKAQIITDYFRRQFPLDALPEALRFLCLDVRKHISIVEETGETRVEMTQIITDRYHLSGGGTKLGRVSESFPATPRGVYAARWRLREAATAYLQAA